MGKQPGFFFYTGDWLKETRRLKPSIKGHWIDLLCAMWDAPTRGDLTWPLHSYCNEFSTDTGKALEILSELAQTGVAEVEFQTEPSEPCPDDCETNHVDSRTGILHVRNCNMIVRVRNRRMYRDAQALEKNREYVKKHRQKATEKEECKENVRPPLSYSSSSSISSSYKEKKKINSNGHSSFQLPDWIPIKEWEEFETHRKRKRAPLTDNIRDRTIAVLATLKELGHKPAAVLTEAVDRNWTAIRVEWIEKGKTGESIDDSTDKVARRMGLGSNNE